MGRVAFFAVCALTCFHGLTFLSLNAQVFTAAIKGWARLYLLVLCSESAAIVKRALTSVLEVRIPHVTYHTFFFFLWFFF